MQKKSSKIKGFSLIELLFVLAIMGTLLALALPSFSDTVEAASTNSQIKVMLTTLNLARSEAIKRGQDVAVCATSDGVDCDAANWTAGWLVFVDNNGDATGGAGSIDPGDLVLRVFESIASNTTAAMTVNMFAYDSLGFSSTGGTQQFTITPNSGSVPNTRCIEIGPSGRGRRVEGADC